MIGPRTRKWGAGALALLTALSLGLGVANAPEAEAGDGYRAKLLRMLNRTRERHDLLPLELDRSLSREAKKHVRQMVRKDRIFDPPDLQSILSSYDYELGGAAAGCAESLMGLHRAWLRSEVHRAILLHPRLRAVGIGVIRNDEKNSCGRRWFWGAALFYG